MIIQTVTGVRSHFSASHTRPEGGPLHGHSYEVWAYWPAASEADQLALQAELDLMLKTQLDHRTLPQELSTMEQIGEHLIGLLGCESVKLERPVEGLAVICTRRSPNTTNVYRHEFTSKCPNNGEDIAYTLELYTDRTVMVEDIIAACATMVSAYHETIADQLFHEFGGAQVIKAHHHGVDVETRRA